MGPLIPILIGIAAEVGAPFVKGILTKHAGPLAGSAAEQVIKTVAKQAGATPETLDQVDSTVLAGAVTTTEPMLPEVLAQWVASQKLSNDLQLAEMAKDSTWTWAWRPAWMWFLGFLWLWLVVALPVTNALTGAAIASIDAATLMGLTGAYLALYLGGHTVKSVWGPK